MTVHICVSSNTHGFTFDFRFDLSLDMSQVHFMMNSFYRRHRRRHHHHFGLMQICAKNSITWRVKCRVCFICFCCECFAFFLEILFLSAGNMLRNENSTCLGLLLALQYWFTILTWKHSSRTTSNFRFSIALRAIWKIYSAEGTAHLWSGRLDSQKWVLAKFK